MFKKLTTLVTFALSSTLALANYSYDFERNYSKKENPFLEINVDAPKLFDLALGLGAQLNTYSPITVELNFDLVFAPLILTNSSQSAIVIGKAELDARWHLSEDRTEGLFAILGFGFEVNAKVDAEEASTYGVYALLGIGSKHSVIEGLLSVSNKIFLKKTFLEITDTIGLNAATVDAQYFEKSVLGMLNFEILKLEFCVL